ncbi:hypothetical protein B0H14DRAFT_3433424 [Mycena olivaceomarginata]|nr:hypothetical protein B0H14DRAFT_3433424 [Mycena olivaceomarginata]
MPSLEERRAYITDGLSLETSDISIPQWGLIFDLPRLPDPTLLEYLEDYYTTHNPSLDVLITLLKVAHLKHYSTDVFTFLSRHTAHFIQSDCARACLPRGASLSPARENAHEECRRVAAHARSPDILLQAISRRTRMTKLGVTLLRSRTPTRPASRTGCASHPTTTSVPPHNELGDVFGSEWVMYDVGGSRSMVFSSPPTTTESTLLNGKRHVWLPYIDAINTLIFRAFLLQA